MRRGLRKSPLLKGGEKNDNNPGEGIAGSRTHLPFMDKREVELSVGRSPVEQVSRGVRLTEKNTSGDLDSRGEETKRVLQNEGGVGTGWTRQGENVRSGTQSGRGRKGGHHGEGSGRARPEANGDYANRVEKLHPRPSGGGST